jgi:hypothetical protein
MTLAVDPVQSVCRFRDSQPTFSDGLMQYIVLVLILCSRVEKRSLGVSIGGFLAVENAEIIVVAHTGLIYSAMCIEICEEPMLSIYRMDQYLRVSDLPTKNNTRDTSHWSGLGSSGVANNYRLLLVETSDEGITENPVSLSLIVQCHKSVAVVTIASDSGPNHSNYRVIEFGFSLSTILTIFVLTRSNLPTGSP